MPLTFQLDWLDYCWTTYLVRSCVGMRGENGREIATFSISFVIFFRLSGHRQMLYTSLHQVSSQERWHHCSIHVTPSTNEHRLEELQLQIANNGGIRFGDRDCLDAQMLGHASAGPLHWCDYTATPAQISGRPALPFHALKFTLPYLRVLVVSLERLDYRIFENVNLPLLEVLIVRRRHWPGESTSFVGTIQRFCHMLRVFLVGIEYLPIDTTLSMLSTPYIYSIIFRLSSSRDQICRVLPSRRFSWQSRM